MIETMMNWLGASSQDAAALWVQILELIWINILLSGDNALVIALACRGLPVGKRMWGIALGAAVAVVLRIVFTIFVAKLMLVPWLKLTGGLLLLWIAVKLLTDHGGGDANIDQSTSLWGAIRTVAVADMVMSLDNVLAIAGAAKGNSQLIVLGLAISIPLIVFGATLVMALLHRLPILIWAGAALLGWIAGEMIASDRGVEEYLQPWISQLGLPVDIHTGLPFWTPSGGWMSLDFVHHTHELAAAVLGTAVVVGLGLVLRRSGNDTAGHPA